MSLDPALAWGLRLALALLFAWAAWHKLRDVAAFAAAVDDYRLLPAPWPGLLAVGLVAVECGVAIGLCLPGVAAPAALAGAALLALYAAAMTLVLRRGRRDVDCGCAGPAGRQSVRPALIARNLVLIGAALAAALPVAGRPFTWVDALTVALTPAVAACLYLAVDGLLANGPRLAALARLRRPEVAGA